MLGFDLSERTISHLDETSAEGSSAWPFFALTDFSTVPTVNFGALYCFFIISHDRRRILHFNVTKNPTSPWIIQQWREAFPFDSVRRFLIFDRAAKYGPEVPLAVRSFCICSVDAGWKAAAVTCWTRSSHSINAI